MIQTSRPVVCYHMIVNERDVHNRTLARYAAKHRGTLLYKTRSGQCTFRCRIQSRPSNRILDTEYSVEYPKIKNRARGKHNNGEEYRIHGGDTLRANMQWYQVCR